MNRERFRFLLSRGLPVQGLEELEGAVKSSSEEEEGGCSEDESSGSDGSSDGPGAGGGGTPWSRAAARRMYRMESGDEDDEDDESDGWWEIGDGNEDEDEDDSDDNESDSDDDDDDDDDENEDESGDEEEDENGRVGNVDEGESGGSEAVVPLRRMSWMLGSTSDDDDVDAVSGDNADIVGTVGSSTPSDQVGEHPAALNAAAAEWTPEQEYEPPAKAYRRLHRRGRK